MRNRLSGSSLAVLALAFPLAALADFSNTQTISSGQHLTMDNGATSTTGGDLLFSGTSITPQGSAKFADLSMGSAGSEAATLYGSIISSDVSFLGTFTTTPISGSSLVANEIFLVLDNAGNYAKVWITAVSGTSLTIQYDTFGAPAGGNTPTITAVEDAGSYTASIAQGSIFVIKGTGLSASGLTETSFPLPTTFGNVSIKFTPLTGGTAIQPYIIYLYNQSGVNQLAALLPSTTATGTYNVTVTNNGATSSPVSVPVVKQKLELITADATGYGLAVIQNFVSVSEYDVNRFTKGTVFGSTISPAHPGQTEIAYSVGMGSDQGSGVADNMASPGYNFLTNGVNVQVIVGGMTITPSYAGRVPGGTGYEQTNFILPTNVQTGCVVPFQISENGTVTQTTFIAIAPAGADACVQPGYTTSQLQGFDNGQTTNLGAFEMFQFSETAAGQSFSEGLAEGGFTQFTGFELAGIPPSSSGGSLPTGCTVIQFNSSTTPTGTIVPFTAVGLDAGKVTLSGPAASNLNNTPLPETDNSYLLTISGFGSTVNGNIVAGTYTLKGAGGTGVGPFTATVTLGTPLAVTGGLPAVVNRGSGLTINWTGGGSTDYVAVVGYSATVANSISTGAEFICYTTAGAGGINISSSILNQLPASTAAAITAGTASGFLEVSTASNVTNFTAPLVAGGTINAFFESLSATGASASYQ